MSRTHLVALLAALMACAATRSADDPIDAGAGTADAAGLTAAGYCEATVGFFCDFYLRCGRMLAATAAECEAVFLESCNARYEPRYVDLEQAGLLSLSTAGIAACEAHLSTVACEAQPLDLGGPCAGMWVGSQPVGAACGLDVESFVCAPDAACVLDLSLCGTCRATAPTGQPCTTEVRCEADAYCDGASCQPRGGPEASCAAEVPCQLGLRCVEGACQGPTYVGEDEACDLERRCPYRATCIDGLCHRDALLGESCGPAQACTSGRCVGETCAAFAADGEPCAGGRDCASGQCEEERCTPLPDACLDPPG